MSRTSCAQQNPMMEQMMGSFDMESPELKQQLESIGMTPEEVRFLLVVLYPDPALGVSTWTARESPFRTRRPRKP